MMVPGGTMLSAVHACAVLGGGDYLSSGHIPGLSRLSGPACWSVRPVNSEPVYAPLESGGPALSDVTGCDGHHWPPALLRQPNFLRQTLTSTHTIGCCAVWVTESTCLLSWQLWDRRRAAAPHSPAAPSAPAGFSGGQAHSWNTALTSATGRSCQAAVT